MPAMASMKETPASCEVSDEEFEEEFEEELEEEFEEELEEEFEEVFEEEMEETLDDEEYEDIEEEEGEAEEEEETVDEVFEKEDTVDKSFEKGDAVEELGEEDEGAKEEELYEEEEEEEEAEEEEETVDEVFEKEDTVDKSFEKGDAVEELGEEDEGAKEEELYEEEEEEEAEEEEEEEEEETVDQVFEKEETVEESFEKEEAVEDLGEEDEGVKEVGVDEKGVEEVKKEMVEVLEVKKEEEFFRGLVGEEEKPAKPEEPSASEGTAPPTVMSNLPLLQSISELEKFHGALSKFLDQWKSLNRSLDSISAAIDAHSQRPVPTMKQEKVDCSEIQIICNKNSGKSLRKYVEHNLIDVPRLRSEVPEALKSVRCPGKLVLQAIGRFYMQMRSCYKDPLLVTYRRASILLLEFLLLSGRIDEGASLKKETDATALIWMNRIISEDIETASAVDSLGLVLFLACYGIPQEFNLKDLSYLLQKSNLKKKGDVFRRSRILVEKIPGIIKALIRDEMYVEAADLSCGFRLTDTFPPLPLLSSSALKAIEVSKMDRQEWMDSPHLVKESDMRQLKILKSVAKCIEDHKLGTQILGSINIYRKIMQLERFLEKGWTPPVPTLKRKAEHLEPYSLPERRSKEPFRSSSETPEDENEHGYPPQPQPQLPGSRLDNSSLPHGWDRRNYQNSAGYRSMGVEYSPAQNVYQPQAPAYGNEGGSSRRDLYKFADTVIEREAQFRNSNRSSNPSSGASMFGRH